MTFERLTIPDVTLVRPVRFTDHRGYFSETWSRAAFAANGISEDFVQDNFSYSKAVGTVRGLHFQVPPIPQAKLVRVLCGSIFDVAVDLRRGASTYGTHVSAVLTAETGEQLFVPVGFAHGFCTLEPHTQVAYKVSGPYSPAADAGIVWDDPGLEIDWPLPNSGAVLSDKDRNLPRLSELQSPF